MERVKCAALRSKNGDIFIGKYHGEIFKQKPKGELRDAEQGFLTNKNRFVDRVEGLEIALKVGQIIKKHNPQDQLLSEDFKCEL